MRWCFANFLGGGDLYFKSPDQFIPGYTIRAYLMTNLGMQEDGKECFVKKMRGYEVGAFLDPLYVSMGTIVYACEATGEMCERLDRLWSDLELPPQPRLLIP